MGSSPMEKIGECNGVTLYFADSRFERPGVYYWDGTDNVRAWPPEEEGAQVEISKLRAELARIEENGTPWVPELLEWLERHDCCPPLPFTDYELIEALESRFGLLPPPARTRERARNILAGELAHHYPNMARALVAGKSMEAYVMVPQALRAIETALKFREKGNV